MQLESISHAYGGVFALRDVDWQLAPGEIHGLVGGNGAGKSTLLAVLSGEVSPTRGTVHRLGRSVAVVHQHPALLQELDVAENLALGRESFWISRRQRTARARELLARVGANIDPARRAGSLSAPERHFVEIARALRERADVLVFDEPTAALPTGQAGAVFALARAHAAAGGSVVWVSHRLDEVLALVDRVTVLRDGRKVGTWPRAGLSAGALVQAMLGGDTPAAAAVPARKDGGEVLLEISGRVELALRAGEITTLFGLVGAGRTELLEALYGLHGAEGLEVRGGGIAAAFRSPHAALAAGVALVPEDRRRDGVVVEHSILQNATLAMLRRDARAPREASARATLAALDVRCADERQLVGTLSGGNQQKVALARMLATRPRVLLLDEPTQGVDVGAKAEIHAIVRRLAARGTAVLAACSELEEARALGDRLLVVREGRIVARFARGEGDDARVLAAAFGTALPA